MPCEKSREKWRAMSACRLPLSPTMCCASGRLGFSATCVSRAGVTARRRVVWSLLLSVMVWLAAAPLALAQETWTVLPAVSTTDTTGEKPQSKAWFHGHTWWTVLPSTSPSSPSGGTWLFRLEPTNTWSPVLEVSSHSGKADTLVAGDVTHVLIVDTQSEMVSLEYVPALQTYQLWSVRPVSTPVSLGATGTLALDSTGRLWLATIYNGAVEVYYAEAPYTLFVGPITLTNAVRSDDVAAIAALPNQTVGVMWSDFNGQVWGFRAHQDSADPTVWLADEVPASAGHLNQNMADNHLHVAVAADGTLYASVKAGHASGGIPLLYLLVRHPASGGGGTWDSTLPPISDSGTRPIIVVNDDTDTLRAFFTTQSGGNLYVTESARSPIAFGPPTAVIGGGVNDATSAKAPWAGRLVVLASNGATQGVLMTTTPGLVGYWKMDDGRGNRARDFSGWGNDATLVGSPTWIAVANGLALNLNGSTSDATVADQAGLDSANGLTLAAWIRPHALANQVLISRARVGSINGYELALSSTGTVFARLNQASAGDAYRVDSHTLYSATGTGWMHVAATYDGSRIRLYVNGVLEGNVPGPSAIGTDPVALGLGAQSDGTRLFNGALDEVRIYNRALTSTDIGALVSASPAVGDLSLTTDDSATSVIAGQSTTYRLRATNLGPDDADATVADVLPAPATSGTWTCTATGGAHCTASGSGDLNDAVHLPVGGTVTYLVQVTVASGASGTLTNTATVQAVGVLDPVSSNNSASDTDTILQPPQIMTPPATLTVTAPAAATFSVVATGTPPLSYQWRRNGVAIAGATSASYTLSPTAGTDSGAQFDVVVSNIVGSVTSSAAALTVNSLSGGNTQLQSPTDPLPYAVDYDDNLSGSEYAVAVWTAPNPNDSLLFVTQKSLNTVQVWSLQTNQIVQTLTGFDKPLGVAVDPAEGAVYVTSQNGQAVYKYFIADIVGGTLTPALTFGHGMSPSSQPSGIAVYHGTGGVTRVFVVYTGSSTHFVRAFDTHGTLQASWNLGSLALNEITADDDNGAIYVADQTNDVIKVYHPDGTFVQDVGQGNFASGSDVEGIAIYRCGTGGYILAADQSANEFEIFDRTTFAHLATFTVQGVRDTIGVALTQAAVPGYPNGGIFLESRGREVFGVSWDTIATATGVSLCAAQ